MICLKNCVYLQDYESELMGLFLSLSLYILTTAGVTPQIQKKIEDVIRAPPINSGNAFYF